MRKQWFKLFLRNKNLIILLLKIHFGFSESVEILLEYYVNMKTSKLIFVFFVILFLKQFGELNMN